MIWIIGGTSEARKLIERLEDFNNYILTIATEDGKQFFPTDKLYIGRLTRDQMVDFAKEKHVGMIVDLSHPYARVVSENARYVSEKLDLKYIRYVRERVVEKGDNIYVNSYEEAYDYLSTIEGTVFFTTGSKNIKDFEKIKGSNRFVYRILPALESLEICRDNEIHMSDIVAILGPFSKEFNKSMLETYRPNYCVMKDSGQAGGTKEKIEACQELGIKALIIGREEEAGISDLRLIEEIIKDFK